MMAAKASTALKPSAKFLVAGISSHGMRLLTRSISTPAPTTRRKMSQRLCMSLQAIKRGQLYIPTRNGFGWHSWRKRWFVLAGRSLIFFKSNPRTQGAHGDLNLILGGIFLKDLGRVLVRDDKKQLSIIYPDGTTFTLKAETIEDLYAWKAALELALSTPMFPKQSIQYTT